MVDIFLPSKKISFSASGLNGGGLSKRMDLFQRTKPWKTVRGGGRCPGGGQDPFREIVPKAVSGRRVKKKDQFYGSVSRAPGGVVQGGGASRRNPPLIRRNARGDWGPRARGGET